MTTTTTDMVAGTTTGAGRRARHDVQDWWVSALRGLVLTFCGMTLLWPDVNLLGVGSVFAGMSIMGSAVLLNNARELRSLVPGVQGLVGFALGVTSILFAEGNQDLWLVGVVAAWAVTTGAFDIFIARRHALMRGRLLLIAGGGVGILGGTVVAFVGFSASPMAWHPVLAVTAIAYGGLLMAAGVRRSRRYGYLAAANASRRDQMTLQREQPGARTHD